MCGIAGEISFGSDPCEARVEKMIRAIKHRGPDDHAVVSSLCGRAVLGHQRLAILDLSDAGRQPMISDDGKTSLVFNGEIYNYRDLRQRFFSPNENFRSTGDTELLLKLWEKMGPDCVRHLRGMFAFAIWESISATLTLVRDACGIKPLYFVREQKSKENRFYFCSELKGLLAVRATNEIDYDAIGLFLKWGSIPAPATPFREATALESGTILTITSEEIKSERFWDYSNVLDTTKPLEHCSRGKVVEYVRECLLDSVRAHLVSDVPVGAFLSGGIDSSGIVSLMRALGQSQVGTFCIGFESEKFNEANYAQVVANKFDTDHTCWTLTKSDFFNVQERFFSSMDQPSVDGLNTFLVSDLAHRSGYKVVTSGIGGDEIFAGYNRDFSKLPKLWKRSLISGKTLRALARTTISSASNRGLLSMQWRRVESYLAGEPTLARCLDMGRGLFTKNEIAGIFNDREAGEIASRADGDKHLPHLSEDLDTRDAVSCFLLQRYLGAQLLKDSDTYSMALSLELRTPLVDSVLYEGLARISNKSLFIDKNLPKSLFIDAIGDLPREITHRSKKGFTPPFEEWLQEQTFELHSGLVSETYFAELYRSFRDSKSHWSRIWALVVLDRFFCRILS